MLKNKRLLELAGILNEENNDIPKEVKDFFAKLTKANIWDMYDYPEIVVTTDGNWDSGYRDYELFKPRFDDDDNAPFIGAKKAEDMIKKSASSEFLKKYTVKLRPSEKNWLHFIVKEK
jgi:hypothetical protein